MCWAAGLLQCSEQQIYIELGAGKGFLALMLARATSARFFILNDIRSFQLKADRFLHRLREAGVKPVQLARIQVDLKDFVPLSCLQLPQFRHVPHACVQLTVQPNTDEQFLHSRQGLQQEAFPHGDAPRNPVGVGTDVHASQVQGTVSNAQDSVGSCSRPRKCQAGCLKMMGETGKGVSLESSSPCHFVARADVAGERGLSPHHFVAIGKHLCGAATDFALRSVFASKPRHGDASALHNPIKISGSEQACCVGVSIAPCCHFRCSWKAFVGKKAFQELGFGQRDFELMSWMSSALLFHWAARCMIKPLTHICKL
jgi:hypothetical protein